jgi:hypothetical protein
MLLDYRQIKTLQEWTKSFKKLDISEYASYIQSEQMKQIDFWLCGKIESILPGFSFKPPQEQQEIVETRFSLKRSQYPIDGKMYDHISLIDVKNNNEVGWIAMYVDFQENKILFKGQ